MYYSKRLQTDFRPLYLVGFMGSGKSTLGRRLASALKRGFIDTDICVEESLDLSIPEVFKCYGESYFRLIEASILRTREADIVATGGGAPLFYEGMSYMNRRGHTIFIDTPWDIIHKRITGDQEVKRPLAGGQNLLELYKKRKSIYQAAQHVFRPIGDLDEDLRKFTELTADLQSL